MARLPQPGSDSGDWGNILNEFLVVAHNDDGTIKPAAIPADSSAQRIAVSKDGVAAGTRAGVNFITGSGASLTVADNAGSNCVDVTIAAPLATGIDTAARALGLIGQTIPYDNASTKYGINSGVCVFMLTYLPAATISSLGTWKVSEGSGPTGVCGMALYTAAGVLVDQTVSMAAAFSVATNEWVSAGLSGGSRAISAGSYYIALLSNMTSGPQIAATSIIHDAPAILGVYPSVYLTGRSTFPASFTPSTAIRNNGVFYLTVH